MRTSPMRFVILALFCLLAVLASASSSLAQTPTLYSGSSQSIPATNYYDSGCYNYHGWQITGPNNFEADSDNPKGWSVGYTGSSFGITVPASVSSSSGYTVDYGTKQVGTAKADNIDYAGYGASFNVVNVPTLPPVGMPAFSWQGSVAGVNTGNGNKTTTLPITGWTMRGGMGVSCALYHNSQGAIGGTYGYKWTPSYFSYISGGASAPTVHWDNGLSYSFTKNTDGSYSGPPGILDKLAYGNGYPILTTANNTVYTFGYAPGNAYLSSIADMDGNTLTINHNSDTTISNVVDATGRTLTYTYSGGHLTAVTDPLGRQWGFVYASGSYLQNIVLPPVSGQYLSLFFGYGDGRQNITQFMDARGNSSTYTYNGDNSLATARDPLGNQTTFTYNPTNTVITDPNGHTTTHTYQYSRLISVTDALNYFSGTAYDYNNIVTSTTDKRGNAAYFSSHFSNDTSTSTSTDPLNYSSSSTYDAKNKVIGSVDAAGNSTANTYTQDSKEDLLTTGVTGAGSSPFKATSSVGGYSYGLPTTFMDPLSFSSSVGYDGNGYPNSATDANSNTTSATYNALGWKLTSTDANNHITRYTYDNWGRVTVVTAPDNTQTGTVYDANGNILRVADADAYAATPIYAVHCVGAAVGRFGGDAYYSGGGGSAAASSVDVSGVADPAPAALYSSQRYGTFSYTFPNLTPGQLYTLRLHFVESGFNAPGGRLFNVAINGGTALSAFDIFAAAGAINKAVIEEFTAAANGSGQLVIAFTPGAANVPVCSGLEVLPYVHTISNNYDAENRLVSTYSGTGNGNGDVVSYTYDGTDYSTGVPQKGLLSYKTDGNGNVTHYTYTVRNEPAATYYADGTQESVKYDANGNTQTRTKADGKVISYTYDADNRLTDITYPTLHATHFDYDADGRKTHMSDASGDTYWTYGDGVHLTQQSSNRGNVLYSYDGDGRRKTMVAPGVNPSVPSAPYIYGYDNGGRMTSLQNPFSETTGYAYNPDNTLARKTLANGASISYGYDAAAQMTGLSYVFTGTTYSHGYTYTPGGELASRSETDGGVNTFGYDGADQLTSETRTGPVPFTHGYTYDHNGNRLTQTQNGTLVQSFTYNGHDVICPGINETFQFDLNGNETGDTLNGQFTRYAYDDEDRLTSVTLADGHTDSYTYNGLGLRLTKQDPSGSYAYYTDGTSPASDVLSDNFSTFTPGISEMGSLGSRFYLADASGNSRGLLDGSQGSTDGYNWDAFGTLVSRFGSHPTGYAWEEGSGYQSDNDTGLVLLGHRYYDTRIGRFLSQYPAGSGDNWYAYADNDPVDEVDPSGLTPTVNIEGWSPIGSPGYSGVNAGAQGFDDYENFTKYTITHTWIQDEKRGTDDLYHWVDRPGSDNWTLAADSSLDGTPADVQLTKELAAADDGTAGTLSQPKGWGKGTYDSAKDCAKDHFERKGKGVNAKDYEEYLRKAEAFGQNLKRATTKSLENGATRFTKTGQYIIKDIEGLIVSYGKAR